MLLIRITVFLFLFLSLSGCWNKREVENLAIVVGIGVDQAENSGDILFTAQVVKPSQAGKTAMENPAGRSADMKAFWNVSISKSSIFEAVREITHKTGMKLFVSHNQVIIFGHELASEGVQKYLDFFMRAHEIRSNNLILVAKSAAADILEVKPEIGKLPAMNIEKLVESYGLTSHLLKMSLQDFAARLMSKTMAPIAPLVEINTDRETPVISVSGMAVFKRDKMAGNLNEAETRGLLWVTSQVRSGVIEVSTPEEQGKATLEIMTAKSKVTPEIKGNRIRIRIQIHEDASLTEQSTSENLVTIPAFEILEKAQAEVIREEIQKAFQKSKDLNCDIFGFGEMIHRKYPKQWKELEGGWDEIYPLLKLDLNIKTKIHKTDLITRPIALEEEGKQ
jgi:spore germination protein KC